MHLNVFPLKPSSISMTTCKLLRQRMPARVKADTEAVSRGRTHLVDRSCLQEIVPSTQQGIDRSTVLPETADGGR